MGTDQATLVLYVLYVFCSSSFNNFLFGFYQRASLKNFVYHECYAFL